MPETKPVPDLETMNLAELAQHHPNEALLLQTVTAEVVRDIEHHHGDLPAEEKARLADEQIVDVLSKIYTGADMWFDFKPAVDFLALQVIIPLIPKARNGIVAFYHKIGVFIKGQSGGVQ